MGVNVQPEGDLSALIVPIYQTLGATMTATTQAGPKPGGFERTSSPSTALALVSSGTLDFAVGDLDVRTLQAGGVERATVRWAYDGENYRSWDPPVLVTGFEFISRTTVASRWIRPHLARLPSTGAVVAVATKNVNDIACWRQEHTSTARGTWVEAEVAATGNNTVGCIVPLPSGRLVSLYVYQTTSTSSQIRMSFSDDSGATWTLGSDACLATDLGKASTAYKRIRAVELNGLLSVLVWEQDTTDTLYQYVSTDGGASLGAVETFSTADKAAPDMTVSQGVIYVATMEYVSGRSYSTLVPLVRALASASMPLSSVDGVEATSSTSTTEWAVRTGVILTSAECALLADDDGFLWLYGQNYDAAGNNETLTRMSPDNGVTWGANLNSTIGGGVPIYTGDSTSYLRDLAVAPERGRAVLLCRSLSGGGASDSLLAAYLGGWSSVGMPQDDGSAFANPGVAGWDQLWLPIDKPQNTAAGMATETLSGTATSTLGSGGLTLAAGAAENAYYTEAPVTAGAPADGILREWHLLVAAGTAVHNITISDGAANSYSIRVSVTTSTVTLRDMTLGANIGTPYSIDATKGIVLRIGVDKGSGAWGGAVGRVRAWVRPDGPYSGATINYGPRADRYWTQIESSTTLTAGSASASAVSWGIVSGSAATVTYRLAGSSAGSYVAGNILDSAAGKSRGRRLASAASPLHLSYGLRVHGLGGPTQAADTWRHRTAYAYPVQAVDPSRKPSPRQTHRSTTDATDHDITWTGLDLGWRSGDPLSILVVGANVPSMSLYSGAGAGVLVATMDMRVTGLGYTRSRGQIIPAAGGTAMPWQASEGALRGARVNLGGGVIRRVRTNHGGAWQATGSPASYASTRLQIEDAESGDPSSGTLDLWMPGGFFLTEALTSTDTLTLRIPAATTRERYFELGALILGRFRVIDRGAWGRSLMFSPAYALSTSSSGARTARTLGPQLEAEEIAFDDGIETTPLYTAGTAPNFVTLGAGSGDAVASLADTPRTLSGLLADIGGVLPVGRVRAFRQLSAATTAASPYRDLDPNSVIYGRIMTETLRVDTVIGDEQRNELVRVGRVRFEGER